jgi:hypothetical protein
MPKRKIVNSRISGQSLPPEITQGPMINPSRSSKTPALPRNVGGITGKGGRRVNKIYNTY